MRAPRVTVRTTLTAALATAAVTTAVLAAAPAATAAPLGSTTPRPTAAGPTLPAGLSVPGGGTVTGPTPVPAPSSDLAAGDVCAFPVHLQFPVNRELSWTYADASGRTVAVYVQGALTGVVTRTDTGRSVTRDLSGQGLFTYAADGSSALTGHGSALVGFHTGDRPGHQLLVLAPKGVAQVRFAPDGQRTLAFGGGEDLCRTLA